jgi:hypothetical protein
MGLAETVQFVQKVQIVQTPTSVPPPRRGEDEGEGLNGLNGLNVLNQVCRALTASFFALERLDLFMVD